MTQQPPRKHLLIIGAVLFVLATVGAILKENRDDRAARSEPSGQTQTDRPEP